MKKQIDQSITDKWTSSGWHSVSVIPPSDGEYICVTNFKDVFTLFFRNGAWTIDLPTTIFNSREKVEYWMPLPGEETRSPLNTAEVSTQNNSETCEQKSNPTIVELEAILDGPKQDIYIRPDGSIDAKPKQQELIKGYHISLTHNDYAEKHLNSILYSIAERLNELETKPDLKPLVLELANQVKTLLTNYSSIESVNKEMAKVSKQ